MNDRQPWRPPVPPKPTGAALKASTIAARNAKPALRGTNDIPAAPSTSKALLAAVVAGGVKSHGHGDTNGRAPSLSPVRGRSQPTQEPEGATKRLEHSTIRDHQAPSQRPRTASELAALLASASSSPSSRPADAALLRPSPRKAGFTSSREPSASDRERSGSNSGATRQRRQRHSKSPDKLDLSKTLPLATSTTGPGPGPVGLAPRSSSNTSVPRASSHSTRTRVNDLNLGTSPPKMLLPDAVQKAIVQSPITLLQPVSVENSDHRKHIAAFGGALHKARARATTSLSVPHTPITSRRTPAHSPNPSRKADRIKDVNNLANAMVGASLASARGLSRAPSPSKKPPLPSSPRRRRSQSLHAPGGRNRPEPAPLKPLTLRPMRHTLRKQVDRDDDEEDKRGRKLRLRKHPNVHHEGDRKRWRDKLTVKQRKRYEGLWAANRGLLHDFETVEHHPKGASIEDQVLNVVVRDIWERSRLPRRVLEEIWDLVAEEDDRALSREQFVAGLWLIDQRLKGRKLPVKVSASLSESRDQKAEWLCFFVTLCDGNLPKCAACASVYLTECEYAPHTDHRRKGVYKNDGQTVKTKSSALQTLIHAILNAEEDAVIDLVRQIRTCDNLEDLAASIDAGDTVPGGELAESPIDGTYEPGEVPKFEAELSGKMGDLWLDGSVKFVGGTSNLIWMPETSQYHQSSLSPGSATEIVRPREEAILSWTTVTQDKDLILHFLNMYFCWHYTYFTTLSKELFYRDFLTGTPSQYCSALLVNVMLALGCHFSTRPAARQNPADSETTGDHYFAEAKRLLYQDDEFANAKLCTVQALALMSVREAGCGRESNGWVYSGMSFRMAFDLGLNVDAQPINQSSRLSPEDIDARRITFWGCFLFDKCWSSYLGRQPQIQMANVTVRRPEVFPSEDSEMWSPYTDSGIIQANAQPARTRAVSLQISKLAEISGDLLTSFYNPQMLEKPLNKQVELKKLSDIHTRLEAWKRDLPLELEVRDSQLPQVLVMHMFSQLLYIHLYRPFLRYTKATSPLPAHASPRKYCTQAAGTISKLFRLYRRTYGLRQICNIVIYIVHTACTIHLLNLPDKNANRDIIHGVKHLEEMGECWTTARRTLIILHQCAERWNTRLPPEAEAIFTRCSAKWRMSLSDFSSPSLSEANKFTSDQNHVIPDLRLKPRAQYYHGLARTTAPSPADSTDTTRSAGALSMPPQSAAELVRNANRVRPFTTLTKAQEDAWNAHQARIGSMAGAATKPNANAAKLFGGIESLIEDSQDWWHMDQSQLALGFGNWTAPTADWGSFEANANGNAQEQSLNSALKAGSRPDVDEAGGENIEFEDDYEDEFESEDEVLEAGVDGRPDAEREADPDAMDVDSNNNQIFIPGRSVLQPGQTLAPDPSTYEMLHVMSTTWPCLSFDIVRDNLGQERKAYPRTVYAVAGTQAETARAKNNELYVLKLSSLSKMERGDQTDSESDDDSDDEDVSSDPILESKSIPLASTTNRIRAFQLPSADPSAIATTLTATWLESGEVVVHDITAQLHSLSTPGFVLPANASNPLSTLRMHRTEGYALDWASSALWPHGRLLSGDNNGQIYMTQRTEGGGFATDQRPFTQHTGSIEELQWSPTEKTVFASASSDGTVKVWDTRSKSRKAAVDVHISNSDVNVMSWSHQTAHLLATGCDDGQWAVWDLRQWRPQSGPNKDTPQAQSSGRLRPAPVASFNFHKKPITSIEWHPTDDSVVGVASADGTVTLWDLSVELDDEEYGKEAGMILDGSERVPPQLLFIHSAEDVKELHWHPQMAGTVMCTGGTGFGVFKTISV
ncbi:hypothetical protein DV738_g4932, partial [Chaetothyriales sp. CBS 135597]